MRGPREAAEAWVRKAAGEEDVFDRFVYLWFAFNALYNEYMYSSESEAIRQFVEVNFEEALPAARAIVDAPSARFFQGRVIRDCRKLREPHMWRRDTLEWAGQLKNNRSPLRQLTALVRILYQVRCNLFHGNKSYERDSDVEVVRHGAACLERLIGEYLAPRHAGG